MELKQTVEAFAALAQDTRLELVRLLAASGSAGLPAGEIAHALGIPPSSLSFHLATLERAGLVRATRQGRQIIYAARLSALRGLLTVLGETCCGGRPELCTGLLRLLPVEEEEETTMQPAFNVLFICTRNSARSLMAEAILERIGRGRFKAYSAGSKPAAAPMPDVVERLASMGHDVSSYRPKSWNEFTGPDAPRMDFVITLCDPQSGEVCPDLGDKPITAVWPFPDPAKFKGSETERATLVFELYGMIRRRLDAFTNLPFQSLDRMAIKARLDELGSPGRAIT